MNNFNFNTIEDLLADESFMAWYLHTNEQHMHTWDEWMQACPKNRELAQKAISLLKRLHFKEKTLTNEEINEGVNRILNTINLSR
jgi:transmembrane sensor